MWYRELRVGMTVAVALMCSAAAGGDHFLRFEETVIDSSISALTTVTMGPDGHLYFAQQSGQIYRHELDSNTGMPTGAKQLLYNPNEAAISNITMIGIDFSPAATPGNLDLFVTYTDNNRGGAEFSGFVARMTLSSVGNNALATRSDYITGLPVETPGNHLVNQMDFRPLDGRLYFNVGSHSRAGGDERPLSAATLVADVMANDFLGVGGTPVDVNTSTGYDPTAPDAKVAVFGPGLRNAYDLTWHSNGELYSPVNGNDSGGNTPLDPDQPGTQVSTRPPEQLTLVREGVYYGHPNATRGQYISHAGNPTAGNDGDWEISAYPVGTQPEPEWDESLNFNILTSLPFGNASVSPDGIAEYTADNGLKGRLLVAFLNSGQIIQSYSLDATGRVNGFDPLQDELGNLLQLSSPLDLTVDQLSGRIYVAGHGGGTLYLLDPVAPTNVKDGDVNGDGIVTIDDFEPIRLNFGQAVAARTDGDLSGDFFVDFVDFNEFKVEFLTGGGSLAAIKWVVPEPSTAVLFIMSMAVCTLRRRPERSIKRITMFGRPTSA